MTPYDRPLRKIKRARELIRSLIHEESSYYANGHYKVIVLDVPGPNIRRFNTEMLDDMGEVFAPIVGDAAHNIRSALDLVTYEIMVPLLQAGDNKAGIKFPIEKDAASHDALFKRRPMSRAPDPVRAKMDEIAHPDSGDREIRALHFMDIQDKHHDGLLVVHSSSLASFRLRDFEPAAMNLVMENNGGVVTRGIFGGLTAPLHARSEPAAVVQAKIDKHMQANMTFQALFSDKEPLFARQPVSDVLLRIAARVEAAIEELRAAARTPQ